MLIQLCTELATGIRLSFTTHCLVSSCVTTVIMFGISVLVSKSIRSFVSRIIQWSIYSLPQLVFLVIYIGMELAIILCLEITLSFPIACFCFFKLWTRRIRGTIETLSTRKLAQRLVCAPIVRFSKTVKALASAIMFVSITISTLVATSLSRISAHWKQQRYGKALQTMMLMPGLAFAMSINFVMYILLFLPGICLAQIRGFFLGQVTELRAEDFIEDLYLSMTLATDGTRRCSICSSEEISELDLNHHKESCETELEMK